MNNSLHPQPLWAFKKDYDSKIWEFLNEEFYDYYHADNGITEYRGATMTDKQVDKAFDRNNVYGYVLLKKGGVRQIQY